MRSNSLKHLVAIVVLTTATVAFGAGEGGAPDNGLRSNVRWLIDEVGTSDDGLTIRESIERTDAAVLMLIEVLGDHPEQIEALKGDAEQLRSALAEINVPQPSPYVEFIHHAIVPVLVAFGGTLFWLAVRVTALSRTQRRDGGDSA
ncbi:MAG: hypothetical protein OXU70_11155 [Gammaproteobacteria bacterium]|nr:hypothetical protein [Gammaproteobacteria bacterium]